MIIQFIVLFSFIHLLTSEQIFRTNIGQDVTFSCIFQNENDFNQVAFMHQTTGDILSVGLELFVDQLLDNNHMELIRFSSNRLDLKIYSVNQNDSGHYTCMLNDDKLSSFLLEIFIPPRFLSYSPIEGSISYPEGSSMNLSCHIFAIPQVNITWIYRDKNKQSKTIHNGEDIYISSLQSSDSGSYECIASNGYHATISRSFYVTIQYPPRVINFKLLNIPKPYIELICEVCSIPLSNIQWIHNDKPIYNNRYFTIRIESIFIQNQECLLTTLTIHESFDERDGRYECRAENFLGYKSQHIDTQPKTLIKARSETKQISYITFENITRKISNSSECLFRLSKSIILFILLILKLVLEY